MQEPVKPFAARFFRALMHAGMPEIPAQFSVVPYPQIVPAATLVEIDSFISLFDRVTTSLAWQRAVVTDAPPIAHHPRSERCFFNAWDFHLAPEQGWQLIEFNDNGSGFLFAGLINRLFYEFSAMDELAVIDPPAALPALKEQVIDMVEREAEEFFGSAPEGLLLLLDDPESLQGGKFREELFLIRDLFRQRGWDSEIAAPEAVHWDGQQLRYRSHPVSFIINRSTDFLWQADAFAALRTAYEEGKVYVAPNPFSYATRSDKRLLEFLSLPGKDQELGVSAADRAVLSAHVPATYLLRASNVEAIARRKEEFFFKPVHGFAGRGVLPSSQVGYGRLRRLLRKGQAYVAQKKVPKLLLQTERRPDHTPLWTDLRVWAYHGKRFLVSGRASREPDHLDLAAPGGWLPTYAQARKFWGLEPEFS